MVIEPVGRRRRGRRARHALWAAAVLVVVCAGAAGAALLAWPNAVVSGDPVALARVSLPGYAGRVTHVVVRSADGAPVPVRFRDGKLWPTGVLRMDERLTVELTVRRPGWAGWLAGRSARTTARFRTPAARLRGSLLEFPAGDPVTVSFDRAVAIVHLTVSGRVRTVRLARPRSTVAVGVVASGSQQAGTLAVSAVPRDWEQPPPPTRVTWFLAREHAQALVEPAVGRHLAPDRPITLTFSQPVREVMGSSRPRITPAVPGHWSQLDTHTLSFRPSGLGYPLGAHLQVRLPAKVTVVQPTGERTTRALAWEVPDGSLLRLQQLLAQAGYLPLDWHEAADPARRAPHAELLAALEPPHGRFTWRYPNTPPELQGLWRTGHWNEITRGAVMMFEHDHGLDVDGFYGPQVWRTLLTDTLAGKRRDTGYSYVYVHRKLPQSLNLWHNGHIVLTSPGNTGVPAAPTQLGSFPVFEHIPVGTMSGTNPDGSHYHDTGIRWISYFNHGDAIHSFNRGSFGTPQSLGCVELPLAAAARVWPYTPIGTLVTIEN